MAVLAAVALVVPGLLRFPLPTRAQAPKMVLPAMHLRELFMTSMRTGWVLDRQGGVYRTSDGGSIGRP